MAYVWIGSGDLANVAGLSPQGVRKALRAGEWRGSRLVVREIPGRGGRSGRQYQVRLDSLPIEIQERWKALRTSFAGRLKHGPKAQAERTFWTDLLEPALALPKHSFERADAVREIASRPLRKPDGKRERLSERTIHRMLDRYEAAGSIAALSRSKRSDAGERRVIVTLRWDKAVNFPDDLKQTIADKLRQYVRGLHKAGESGGSMQMLASAYLYKLTLNEGCSLPDSELRAACLVPTNVLRAERVYRNVHKFKTDRKAYEDKNRPRIRRTRAGLNPMDIVVADIHPIDILVCREDGSTATPRAIAWLDLATNRVWMDFVLLDKGEGVRNTHVIASCMNMIKAMGAPRNLYLDNGSEYNWADFIDDFLKLINSGYGIQSVAPWADRASHIIRAQAYNAAAKPIEGIFGVLERYHFSLIKGWIGGDRMNKRTASVGRAAKPFDGTFDDLRSQLYAALAFYEAKPQAGSLKGKSPRDVYAAAVNAGWHRTDINPNDLRIAFSTEESRQVLQGGIRYGGRIWTHDKLISYQGDRVTILVGKYENWNVLPVLDAEKRLICLARVDEEFDFLETKGALEAHRRKVNNIAAVRMLDRSVPDVDVLGDRNALVAALPALPVAPVVAKITHSEQAAEIAAELKLSPAGRQQRDAQRREAERQAQFVEQNRRLEIRKRALGGGAA